MAAINGIEVDKLVNVKEAVNEKPALGKKNPTAKTIWLGGMKSVTRIRDFEVTVDEPLEIGGKNTAQTPTETLLASLGSCLAVGYAVNAAMMGINIEKMEIDVEGDTDMRGFFGIREDKRGYLALKAKVHIKSNAGEEELKRLHDLCFSTSPVGNTLATARPLSVEIVPNR